MARRHPIRNTYEEFPDELKETLQQAKKEHGLTPISKATREGPLHDHEWHLKFLSEGALPPRNLILPPPYPPSQTSTSEAQHISIEDLRIGTRIENELLFLRTIAEPYIYSSTVTIAEDEAGDTVRLSICNLDDSAHDPAMPQDTILAIKQPCWTKVPRGGYHIRIDHPSDFGFVSAEDTMVPAAWRQDGAMAHSNDAAWWKKEGDVMFLKKRFRRALESYDHALVQLKDPSDIKAKSDLYRKRCGVNLVLLRFDNAAKDLSQAISLHINSASPPSSSDLTDPLPIEEWLQNRSTEGPLDILSSLPPSLKALATRIKFDLGMHQTTPEYDLPHLYDSVGPSNLHVDAASYTSDTEARQTPHHGRGLFAKRAFKTGDLIMAEKAFAIPAHSSTDSNNSCSLYSLGDGTATDSTGALLFQELVQKLTYNPSSRRQFFDMDDGGYWEEHGWQIPDDEVAPVDVFRIEHIRRRNCFSAPLRSLDLLTIPSPFRNGFWILSSYVNHSCLPNSVRSFLGDMLFLRATRDIEEAEEITSQYVAPELEYGKRQDKFSGTWGFECDCPLCVHDKGVGQELEARRMKVFEELKNMAMKIGDKPTVSALKKFEKRLSALEALYPSTTNNGLPKLCLVHPSLFLAEAWRSLKQINRTMECSYKLLGAFSISTQVEGEVFRVVGNVGLVNVETVRALKYIAEGFDSKGRTELASIVKEKARCWFRVVTGTEIGFEGFMSRSS